MGLRYITYKCGENQVLQREEYYGLFGRLLHVR